MFNSEIIPTNGADFANHVQNNLSVLSPDVALNMPLAELVQTVLSAAAGESEHTARAYQSAIGLFLSFLGDRESRRLPAEWLPLAKPTQEGRKTVWEYRGAAGALRLVSAGVLDDFKAWRAGQGDGKATQALRRRAVNTFLNVAYRDGVLTQEQAVNLGLKAYHKRERQDIKPVGRRLSREEVRLLRDYVITHSRNKAKFLRDRAILDTMLFAWLRREEVANLTTGNLKQDGGRWWLVLSGKGQKTRRIKVHDVLYKSLAAWLSEIGLTMGVGNDVIFCNMTKSGRSTGKQLNPSVIERIVAEYGAASHLAPLNGENRLSPHDLRRTGARNAYDNGASLLMIQQVLGHADVKTTSTYIGAFEDDDNTAIDKVAY